MTPEEVIRKAIVPKYMHWWTNAEKKAKYQIQTMAPVLAEQVLNALDEAGYEIVPKRDQEDVALASTLASALGE